MNEKGRRPGEVFEKDGERWIQTDVPNIAIQVTQKNALNQLSASTGSAEYAEIALDEWELSPELSAIIKPHIPSERDMLGELRRSVPPLVELMPDSMPGSMFVDVKQEIFRREKFYMRAFVEGTAVMPAVRSVDVDSVRRACFAAARLLGEYITQRVGLLRANKFGRADEPIVVRFVKDAVFLQPGAYGQAFAAIDRGCDRIAMRFCSYFCITSAHDRDWAAEYNKRRG